MDDQIVVCPYCKKEIPLTEAVTHQIRERLRDELDQEAQKRRGELAEVERSLKVREQELENAKISLDEVLSQKLKNEKEKLLPDLKKQIESQYDAQLKDLANELNEKQEKLRLAGEKELELRKRQRELEEKSKAVEIELQRQIDEERKKLEAKYDLAAQELQRETAERTAQLDEKEKALAQSKRASEKEFEEKLKAEYQRLEREVKEKVDASIAIEIKDLKTQVREKEERLQKAQDAELEVRKEKRELEEAKKSFELEMNRKLDQERQRIKADATKALTEEFNLKELDREKLISDMKKQIEDLRRKAEQGSQESQGEVLEIELEELLRAAFPHDQVEPVLRGRKGADILQRVHNQTGKLCGTIIWESKRTKTWSDAWVEKLRDDQREAKAEIAAIFTIALPESVPNFGHYKGIWVTDYSSLVGLATALRANLIQLSEANSAALGKNEKMAVLYSYLSGPAFRQKVEGIVEAFVGMKEDLDAEKRSMSRIWAKREKQIERVITNTVSMYGDMQGSIGASLPKIKSLELIS
jgi:hypothetical protein